MPRILILQLRISFVDAKFPQNEPRKETRELAEKNNNNYLETITLKSRKQEKCELPARE